MSPLKLGALPLVLLVLLISSGCRKDQPPALSIICLGDGVGGADCSTSEGKRVHKLPSELKNYWMTTNNDFQNFSAWCYQIDAKSIKQEIEAKRAEIEGYPVEVVTSP